MKLTFQKLVNKEMIYSIFIFYQVSVKWWRLSNLVVVKEGQSSWLGWIGGLVLVLYGVATFQVFPTFGRVYAAYGGVFIIMSIIWSFVFDKQIPDKYDVLELLLDDMQDVLKMLLI